MGLNTTTNYYRIFQQTVSSFDEVPTGEYTDDLAVWKLMTAILMMKALCKVIQYIPLFARALNILQVNKLGKKARYEIRRC